MDKDFNSLLRLSKRFLACIYHFAISLLPQELQLKLLGKKLARFLKKDLPSVAHLVQDGDTIIDIGANVGAFTQIVLDELPNCKAYLFEPVPKYYSFCRNKFSKNKNITVENYALSDENGPGVIYADKTNLGWNTLIKEKTTKNMVPIDIKKITFDEYWGNKSGKISLMKIDVEGAEFSVLKGMKKTLKKLDKKPHLLLEVGWGKNNHPYWDEEVAVFEWLFDNGYERFDYNGIASTRDVIICPKKQKKR